MRSRYEVGQNRVFVTRDSQPPKMVFEQLSKKTKAHPHNTVVDTRERDCGEHAEGIMIDKLPGFCSADYYRESASSFLFRATAKASSDYAWCR
jgi:hypothetical protein